MQAMWRFAKTTILGGVLVLLPAVLVWLVLEEMISIVDGLLAPITASLPPVVVGPLEATRLPAIVVLLLVFFLTGLAMKTRLGAAIGRGFENAVLRRLPLYSLIKTLTLRLANYRQESERFAPALVPGAAGQQELAFVVEEHAPDSVTVFVPLAPALTIGTIRFVERSQVRLLKAPMATAVGCVLNWGIGSHELFPPASGE